MAKPSNDTVSRAEYNAWAGNTNFREPLTVKEQFEQMPVEDFVAVAKLLVQNENSSNKERAMYSIVVKRLLAMAGH